MSTLAKMFSSAVLVTVLGLVPWPAAAAGSRIESGSVAFLSQEKHVNLEFDCSEMRIGRKLKTAVPVPEFVAQLNQKRGGSGDGWKMEWIGSTNQFQLKFQELLNKQVGAGGGPLEFGAFKDAKYTLILKTTTLLTGSAGFAATPPRLFADAVFVETSNRTNPLAVIQLKDLPGVGMWEFDMREAYAKAGKELGALLRKKIK